ncbi:MAG: hypothetical protein V1796_03510 [Pseudomonadota bacterium]
MQRWQNGVNVDFIYTISARGKTYREPVLSFLRNNFGNVPLNRIDSLFGFVDRCTLYGGRIFEEPQLSSDDVLELYAHRIGLRIPLTNHYVKEEEYRSYGSFLNKYHAEGNSVIILNDKLTHWIRRDFPKYKIESSVIKDTDTYAKIDDALSLYDTVVLPMRLNYDLDFLDKIKDKSRITLFANAGCALNCPARICYGSISKINKFKGAPFMCSKSLKDREILGMVDFDLDQLASLGFRRFKLLRAKPRGVTAY